MSDLRSRPWYWAPVGGGQLSHSCTPGYLSLPFFDQAAPRRCSPAAGSIASRSWLSIARQSGGVPPSPMVHHTQRGASNFLSRECTALGDAHPGKVSEQHCPCSLARDPLRVPLAAVGNLSPLLGSAGVSDASSRRKWNALLVARGPSRGARATEQDAGACAKMVPDSDRFSPAVGSPRARVIETWYVLSVLPSTLSAWRL